MIRQLLLLSGRRYIVGYSDQLVSQFLDWANTKLVECHAIQASFQLLLVMTCLKTATAFLSNISERKESMNLETNYKNNTNCPGLVFSDQASNANDPNTTYNIFIKKYISLFVMCFPFEDGAY